MKECTVSLAEVIERLRLFNSKAEEVTQFSFWKKATHPDSRATLRMTQESISSERVGADHEATSATVLALRFWLQPRDGIELGEIVAVYNELPIAQADLEWVNVNYGDHLRRMDSSDIIEARVDGELLTQRIILETFVYGSLAHVNEDKRKLYEKFRSPEVKAFMEGMFEAAVCDFLLFVFWLARMNELTIAELERIVASEPRKSISYFK